MTGYLILWRSHAVDVYLHVGCDHPGKAGQAMGKETDDRCAQKPGSVATYAGHRYQMDDATRMEGYIADNEGEIRQVSYAKTTIRIISVKVAPRPTRVDYPLCTSH